MAIRPASRARSEKCLEFSLPSQTAAKRASLSWSVSESHRSRTDCGTRTISASPWPPPPQRAAAPTPPPRRLSSRARCSDHPGARHADRVAERDGAAVDVDHVVVDAELRAEAMPTAAKASLISTRSRSAGRRCPPSRSAFAVARPAAAAGEESGPATWPCAPISASHGQARAPRPWPCSSRRPRRRRRRSARRCRR